MDEESNGLSEEEWLALQEERTRAYRRERQTKIHGWAAGLSAAAIVFVVWDSIYLWILGLPFWLIVLGLGGALAYAVHAKLYSPERNPVMFVWVVAGMVLLSIFAIRAIADASDYHYANCWKITGTKNRYECVPGSEPRQSLPGYNQFTDTETPGRFCELVNTTSSGGTIWVCDDS